MNTKQTIRDWMEANGIAIVSQFVPFSQSRHAKEQRPCFNWRVTVQVNGQHVLSTDYSAGVLAVEGAKAARASVKDLGGHNCIMRDKAVREECETGRAWTERFSSRGQSINPDPVDVFACLIRDTDAMDFGNFEDWAESLGFDPDSRKAETIYRDCLAHALALRAALGAPKLAAISELVQDY